MMLQCLKSSFNQLVKCRNQKNQLNYFVELMLMKMFVHDVVVAVALPWMQVRLKVILSYEMGDRTNSMTEMIRNQKKRIHLTEQTQHERKSHFFIIESMVIETLLAQEAISF